MKKRPKRKENKLDLNFKNNYENTFRSDKYFPLKVKKKKCEGHTKQRAMRWSE